MISADLSQLKALERDLGKLSAKAQPYANVNTLNQLAFTARREGQSIIREDFVNRNAWTARSVQVQKATIGRTYSLVGSTAPYMATQEFGGTEDARGKHGVPVATKETSGEGQGPGVRKKLPKRMNKMTALVLANRGQRRQQGAMGRKQRNAIAVTTALRARGGVVFLELNHRKGLFRVKGTRQRADIRMLYDQSHKVIKIKKTQWLHTAVARASAQWPAIYETQLKKQIELQKLFRSRR